MRDYLSSHGLRNETANYYEMIAPKVKSVPYCHSKDCCRRSVVRKGEQKTIYISKVEKNLVGRPDNCPDCGHALNYKTFEVREFANAN